jgi:hypothetical protein
MRRAVARDMVAAVVFRRMQLAIGRLSVAVAGLRPTRMRRPVVRLGWLGSLRGLGPAGRWARHGKPGKTHGIGCLLGIGRRAMTWQSGARRQANRRASRHDRDRIGLGCAACRMDDNQDDPAATCPTGFGYLGRRRRCRSRSRLGRWRGGRCRRRIPRGRAHRRFDGGRWRCRAGARRRTGRRGRRQRDGRGWRGTGRDLVRRRQPGDAEAECDARQHEVDDAERDDQTEALCGGHAVRSLLVRGSLTSRPLRRW